MTRGLVITTKRSSKGAFDFASPAIRVAPSLLSADFAHLEHSIRPFEASDAEVLHLDVMDGHFVPNISFGVPVIASLRRCTRLFFDTHLMISEPARYAEAFAKAGCDHLTFHIEVTDRPAELVDQIHALGISAGVALNPTTPVQAIEPILESVDLVLVMSVWPGFGGQKFITDVLDKVRQLRGRLRPEQRLEIDGGVDPDTIEAAAEAGVDTFVAGTAVFGQSDPLAAMRRLHELAVAARSGN